MNDLQRARFTRWLNTTSLPIPYQLRIKAIDWLIGTRPARAVIGSTNLQMTLELADALQVNMYLDGYWDRKLSNWLAFFAGRGQVFADIGAHVGYFSLLMSHYGRPNTVVHAFEPNPSSFASLQSNIALNHLTVVANPLAVTESRSTQRMQLPHRFLSGATRFGVVTHAQETVVVSTINLDEYCQQQDLSGFDLIKMDIEGGEVQAIVGMETGLSRGAYGVLLIELHASILPPAQAQKVYDDLHRVGYLMFNVLPDRLALSAGASSGIDYHCCALSPRMYADLGSPLSDFYLPPQATLPFPVGME